MSVNPRWAALDMALEGEAKIMGKADRLGQTVDTRRLAYTSGGGHCVKGSSVTKISHAMKHIY